jgi:prevent-host-death family protein
MRKVALSEIKDQLSKYLREAQRGEVLITLHGKPAGILVGFATEDDWFDYRLENDPRFLDRVGRSRESIREGRGVRIEELSASGRPHKRMRPDRTRSRRVSRRQKARG